MRKCNVFYENSQVQTKQRLNSDPNVAKSSQVTCQTPVKDLVLQPPMMSSFKSQVVPLETSQVGLNFRGFSHAGKPVQIKHPGTISEGTDYSQSASNVFLGSIQPITTNEFFPQNKIMHSANQNSLQNMKIGENSTMISITPTQKGRNSETNQPKITKSVIDPSYSDFQRILQGEIQNFQQQQQMHQSNEAYQLHVKQLSTQSSIKQPQSYSQTSINFSRPGRKVVQRPPSAKQYKFTGQKMSQKLLTQSNQGPLSSQSITLRPRGTPSNKQKGSLHQTAQQQHLKAVRNQKDAMSAFIDKKPIHADHQQQPTNYYLVKANESQANGNHHMNPFQHQQQHFRNYIQIQQTLDGAQGQNVQFQVVQQPQQAQMLPYPSHLHGITKPVTHRDFGGLIVAPGSAHIDQRHINNALREGNSQPQQQQQVPLFIKKSGPQQQSQTLVQELHKLQLIQNNLGPAKQQLFMGDRSSESALIQQKKEQRSVSPANVKDIWRMDQMQVRDSMPAGTQQMVTEGDIVTAIKQDSEVVANQIASKPSQKQVKPFRQQSQSIQTVSMTLQHKKDKQKVTQLQAPTLLASNEKNPIEKSVSSKTIQQKAAKNIAQSNKMLDSRHKTPENSQQSKRKEMRKSGTLGRTTSTIGDRSNAMEESKKRPASSKYDSNRNGLFKQGCETSLNSKPALKAKVKEQDSYGEQSYGSNSDESGSYYSDYDDEEEKEQLEYDDQKEYTSGRLSAGTLADIPAEAQQKKNSKDVYSVKVDTKKDLASTIQVKKQRTTQIDTSPLLKNDNTLNNNPMKKSQALPITDSKPKNSSVASNTPKKNDIKNQKIKDQAEVRNRTTPRADEKDYDKISENLLQAESEDEEDMSAGYLDGEGCEEESELNQLGLDQQKTEDDGKVVFLPRISPAPEPKLLIQLSQKSPDVRISMRSVKLKEKEGLPPSATTLHSAERSSTGLGIQQQLGISSSAKVIEKQSNQIDQLALSGIQKKDKMFQLQSETTSKKSQQLSDSCPKENLVRKLYQRPGILSSYDGLNTRLRSMSMRRSNNDLDSATSQYQLRQNEREIVQKLNQQVSEATIELELKEKQQKTDCYNESDPYTQKMPVYLCKSPFIGRPPTVFFQYPPGIADSDKVVDREHIFKMKQNKFKMKFKIADSVHTYNCVVNSLCWNGFAQTDGTGWNVLWSAPLKPETLRIYDMYKHCNHFPGTWQLGRKDLMFRNMSAQIREFGDEYNIVPKTWILPYDLRLFQKEREETTGKNLWILKPAASSCGRGIKILSKHSSIPKKGPYVVNQYIMKPHLLGGFKYDLRLYVLITSFEPLTIYLYKDGLVRFATQPYTTKNRKSRFAHLTNFSVNKKASNYKKAGQKDQEEENSSKWRLKTLIKAYKAQELNWNETWEKIKDLVIKAVISVEPTLANNLNRASRNRHLCFEIYGFDVIIDHNMKPWLLEVNVLPSLSSSSQLDKKIKTALMTDVFSTIGLTPYNRKKFERAQEFNYWNRFSGLTKRLSARQNTINDSAKKQFKAKQDDGQQLYFGSTFAEQQHIVQDHKDNAGAIKSDGFKNYGNVTTKKEEIDVDSSDDENLAWILTQNNMAQSQSNYVQGKIRSVKELNSTHDWNIEEQLVIVELCEEYCRRGNFEMIFPRKSNCEKFRKYFKVQRASNTIVWRWLKLSSNQYPSVGPHTSNNIRNRSSSKHNQSRNQLDSTNQHANSKEPKTRFSVLKDFKIRATCANHYIEAIQQI